MKHIFPILLCLIDIAACGFSSPGAATAFLNQQSNWTLMHPHTIGPSADGTFFVEMVLPAKRQGDVCSVVWSSPAGIVACPQ